MIRQTRWRLAQEERVLNSNYQSSPVVTLYIYYRATNFHNFIIEYLRLLLLSVSFCKSLWLICICWLCMAQNLKPFCAYSSMVPFISQHFHLADRFPKGLEIFPILDHKNATFPFVMSSPCKILLFTYIDTDILCILQVFLVRSKNYLTHHAVSAELVIGL